MKKKYDAVIIGAGITGLTVALLLKQKGLSVLIIEKNDRIGGAIYTLKNDRGYIYESGPTTACLSNIETVRLFDLLKGKCELEIASEEANRRIILKNSKCCMLPSGLIGGIKTPLFKWKDKFRFLGEPFRKPGTNPNEDVATLVKRRMGNSFLDYAVQPFIGGIYAGDPNKLITRFALPKLYNLEQQYGSFIKGGIKKAHIPRTEEEKRVTRQVFSVKGGFGKLIHGLAESVGYDNIRLNEEAYVNQQGESYLIRLNDQEIETPKVIATVNAHAASYLFEFMPETTKVSIRKMNYARIVQVAVGIKCTNNIDTSAFGMLIPSVEKRNLLGVLFPSSCFESRSSEGNILFSVFLGGVNHPEMIEKTDLEIREIVINELKSIYGLSEDNVDFMQIFRHPYAIPQYEICCEEILAEITTFEQQYPGIILAGNVRNGIGIPNRIKQAFDISDTFCKKTSK